MRRQRLLSFALLLFTLSIGIIIGTLINSRATATGSMVAPDATPITIPSAVELGNEFTRLAKKLEPSVVYITADANPKERPTARKRDQQQPDDDESDGSGLFHRFLDPFEGGSPRMVRPEQSGTGFVVDHNGYIITNYHVIDKMDRIRVRLHVDSSEYRARVVGTDTETDLAVIKIDRTGITPVTMGNSDAVRVGDWAVAIGSPFGLEASVTAGIVSATGRDVGGPNVFQRFIQTDAAINPGNSGGPLLNIRGEVIGVNTMIATQSGGYQGIGFALPTNMAVRVYNDVIRSGRVTRGSIGIEWNKLDKPDLLRALGADHGVFVGRVIKDGPADKAGVKQEDIILSLNGKPVKDGDDLVNRVADLPVGSPANVLVDRSGKKLDLKLTIGDRAEVLKERQEYTANRPPDSAGPKVTEAKFGISIRKLNESERDTIGSLAKDGVRAVKIEPGSFADDVGLIEGDVIVSINRQPVATVDDVKRLQAILKPGSPVAFRILRQQQLSRRQAGVWNSLFLSGTLPTQ